MSLVGSSSSETQGSHSGQEEKDETYCPWVSDNVGSSESSPVVLLKEH